LSAGRIDIENAEGESCKLTIVTVNGVILHLFSHESGTVSLMIHNLDCRKRNTVGIVTKDGSPITKEKMNLLRSDGSTFSVTALKVKE